MGSGKTTWCINEILNKNLNENILYITPYLAEIDRIKGQTDRTIYSPTNKGTGKIGNIVDLISNQDDIAATHELFRRFDDRCKTALTENEYTLILDETLEVVEPYHFNAKDDYQYLIDNHDIEVDSRGCITWTGSELNTRFDDVRILAQNKCLFKVDDKFFLWHFPIEIFKLFKQVYVLTYLFDGSLMKNYFDLYHIDYEIKSLREYHITDFYKPDKSQYCDRINLYNGKLNENISQKNTMLSTSWSKSSYSQNDIKQIQKNIYNYIRNIVGAKSEKIMWTCIKPNKKKLEGKGYTNGFVSCNARASNNYADRTCLIYAVNWFCNPEIVKFFKQNGIEVNQDAVALSTILQWIWRSNIRVPDSNEPINIYIPSRRMRTLFTDWLAA